MQFGEQAYQMQNDHQCPIEVGNISFRWRVVGIIQVIMESLLALPDFSDCFFEYRHDITEIHRRMVGSTGRGMIRGSLGPCRPICRGLMGLVFVRVDSNGWRSSLIAVIVSISALAHHIRKQFSET